MADKPNLIGEYWIFPDGQMIANDDLLSFMIDKVEVCTNQNCSESEYEKVMHQLWLVIKMHFENMALRPILMGLAPRIMEILDVKYNGNFAFYMGSIYEQRKFYHDAVEWYFKANNHSGNVTDEKIKYFIKNNLAYCLNIMERHSEAEYLCREAININSDRHNAFKNIGISLEAQGKYREAADSFIIATLLCPHDSRAMALLEELVNSKKELFAGTDFESKFEHCKVIARKSRNS